MASTKQLFLARFGGSSHTKELMRSDDSELRYNVASNPTISHDQTSTLMNDRDWKVRRIVAMRDNLDPSHADQLSRDSSTLVRVEIAKKAHPGPVLDRLVNDPMDFIRMHAATNPNLTPDHIERLKRDSSSLVRSKLISNQQSASGESN